MLVGAFHEIIVINTVTSWLEPPTREVHVKKCYIVTDLGPGDGGKGGIVHRIATLLRAICIIKAGGFQGNHGVHTSRGERMDFSQWGCGTLEGIRTHISTDLIVSPEGLLNEADQLQRQCGINNPWSMLTIDENALCSTEFHGVASRIKEMARGKNPRGTIGSGAGQCHRYNQSHPKLSIFMRDLRDPKTLRFKLNLIRLHIASDLIEIIEGGFLPTDNERVQDELSFIMNPHSVNYVLERFLMVGRLANIVDSDYMAREILSKDGVVVVESSHGVLTDNLMGFAPHTSAIRTIPLLREKLIKEAGYDGQIVHVACHRAYNVRHGAGPMPTTDPSLNETLLPGSSNDENRWQGHVRVGPLDLPLLRYAIAVSGPELFNGLALTWFDQIVRNNVWHVVHRYSSGTEDRKFFTADGELRITALPSKAEQHAYTRELGDQLSRCVPEITSIPIPDGLSPEELFHLVEDVLNNALGIELAMLSLGPTETDKVLMAPKSQR